MMRVDWELALISLSFVPIAAWRSIVARLQTSRGWRLYQEEMGRLTKVMDENLKGIRVVRSFSAEPYEMEKYDKSSNEAFNRAFHLVGVRAKNLSIITLAFLGVMSVVLLVGGLKVLDENDPFSLGQLAQFLAFMSIMQNPVRQLGMVVAGWAQGATSGKSDSLKSSTKSPKSTTNLAQKTSSSPTARSASNTSTSRIWTNTATSKS